MTEHVDVLPASPPNAEKIGQTYMSIRSYVPTEFQNDPRYVMPTAKHAKATKQARLAHRAAVAVAAKDEDRRDRMENANDTEQSLQTSPRFWKEKVFHWSKESDRSKEKIPAKTTAPKAKKRKTAY
ncbi:hypothetical protein F441_05560 [Phytophthora nicotianae CJ01A1]|uniref:Uncharacterized protein n=2 Tax=Phytophthora nicotianae TaxID=4792 RepID=W2HR45_PHYNI|nr:hypothetical protein L915_21654 [Phytophthora nicotianae]ETL24469.1 hypothetical protein L916_21526 [Phytophthora nicotianae]ETP20802.1 hypothetical protein F441_05560 [Phytophthora nicotianae CJ01A1]